MKILALAIRIIQQFLRDKRTLGLIFVVPIIILWIFSLVLVNGDQNVKVGYYNLPENMVQMVEEGGLTLHEYSSLSDADQALKDKKVDAYLTLDGQTIILKLEGSNIPASNAVIKDLNSALRQSSQGPQLDITYLYGTTNMDTFDTTGPVFLGFFAFFFVFLLAGISFVRERLTGTLERILVSPVKRIEVVLGYVLGFSFFALIQSVLVALFTVKFLDMYNIGSFINVAIVTVLIALSALTLGTFLSAFANNEFQIMQFIPIVIVPQIFFTGLLPINNLPTWLLVIGKLYPLTYGADVLRNIMFKGQSLGDNMLNISIIILFSVVFIFLNMFALRKQRKS